jgi:hypothetical protein
VFCTGEKADVGTAAPAPLVAGAGRRSFSWRRSSTRHWSRSAITGDFNAGSPEQIEEEQAYSRLLRILPNSSDFPIFLFVEGEKKRNQAFCWIIRIILEGEAICRLHRKSLNEYNKKVCWPAELTPLFSVH